MARRATKNPSRLAFHVLAVLGHGSHTWLTRAPLGYVTASTGKLAAACSTDLKNLYRALDGLVALGLLAQFNRHNHYVAVRLVPYAGAGWLVGDALVIDTAATPPRTDA